MVSIFNWLQRRSTVGDSIHLRLTPAGGEVYAHVFENLRVSVPRALYWAFRLDFEDVYLDDEQTTCSLGIEWAQWRLNNWRDLDSKCLGELLDKGFLESSIYLLEEHNRLELTQFAIEAIGDDAFSVHVEGAADVNTTSGLRRVMVQTTSEIRFTGVIVVPSNLSPSPETAAAVREEVARFIAIDNLTEPKAEGFRYVLRPAV